MKVLQLIDSLDAGGAERMAVTIANGLSSHGEGAYLCATRQEGLLKKSLSNTVDYLFLNKKSVLDLKALYRLHRFVSRHGITIIHAHSTSFFLGTLIKILNPKLLLIWHDHYGKSEFLEHRPRLILKWCSFFFNHVCTVNKKLEQWNRDVLHLKSVRYLPNFVAPQIETPVTVLQGVEGKRIICLANLRPQKDHINLLKAFKIVKNSYPDWTLHLVGQDFKDGYSETIKAFIDEHVLGEHVFMYGSCPDTAHILHQVTIGVLSSKSEGLPLALLEYGMAGLSVVVTDVGDCKEVVSDSNEGILILPEQEGLLAKALVDLIENEALRTSMGHHLKTKINTSFSEQAILNTLLGIYKTVGS
ncbi:MAG: glycosyltransferase [Flavobacteriales bacterium 32-35-8]|nr:MAG: glycosyltransferase [Flavobacteriales bacterium 32-35-8]